MILNEQTFRQWWDIFHGQDTGASLTEIRLINKGAKRTASGYFTNCETALQALKNYPEDANVYSCLNAIRMECYGRQQHDMIMTRADSTTSDNDISLRTWLLIDLDPKRPTGCNATDKQLGAAWNAMRAIGVFLRDNGFSSPVVAMSGNGYHLYYRVQMQNDERAMELAKSFLAVLDMMHSTAECEVDCSVFNASRIVKVIGTKSVKGANTKEQPQRESYFVKVPERIEVTDIKIIERLAAMMPKPEQPSRDNHYSTERFDIEDFISKHGIRVEKRSRFKQGTKLVLAECPFDSSHKAPDAAIFVMDSGAIGFKCLHNSCSQYTWRDVRIKYEPDAYTYRERDEYHSKVRINTPKPAPRIEAQHSEPQGEEWLQMSDIEWQDPNLMQYIPTGIKGIDYKIGGLALGDVTLLSGLAGAGKTSLINMITLAAVQHGYKVAVWSGELQPARFQSWIDQAAAGRNYVKQRGGIEGYYYCPKDAAVRINKWLDGKLWLRNNDYGQNWTDLFDAIRRCVETNGTQLIILDNLAALTLDGYEGEKILRQSQFIADVKDYAKKANVHIIQVAHPRKENQYSLLRMESISGTMDLVNLADNVLLAHRVGNDFYRRAKDFFGSEQMEGMTKDKDGNDYNEIIEIAKNRSHGIKDATIGLFFELKTRRFLNVWEEYVVYGWQEEQHYERAAQPVPPDPIDNGLPFEATQIDVPF